MWRAGVRAAMTFAFTIFGRKVIALAGTVILLFATALLLDLKMYISAALAGVLAFAALIAFFIQYRRQIKANRIRARRQEEAAQKRAAATEARNEKMDRAKSKVTDTVKGMASGAADVAKTGFAGARDRVQGWRK
jgi:membrane protein implicated in regulation of membrane protease activity